ncbi:MAG: thioredoxin domain-containing protein [Patescibacteria group bacterium]|jgi:protein-disulfide isomerase
MDYSSLDNRQRNWWKIILLGAAVLVALGFFALVAVEVASREQKMREILDFAGQAENGQTLAGNPLLEQLLDQIPNGITTQSTTTEALFFNIVSSTIDNTIAAASSSISSSLEKSPARQKAEKIDRPYLGNINAQLVIVEFADFQCPVCQEEFSVIRTIANKYEQDILFIFRNYPVKGDDSMVLAQAGYCAQEQGKFWPFHDRLFLQQGNFNNEEEFNAIIKSSGLNLAKFNNCLKSLKYQPKVTEDIADALDLGARGTPTFYVNGKKLEGAVPLNTWEELIKLYKGIK